MPHALQIYRKMWMQRTPFPPVPEEGCSGAKPELDPTPKFDPHVATIFARPKYLRASMQMAQAYTDLIPLGPSRPFPLAVIESIASHKSPYSRQLARTTSFVLSAGLVQQWTSLSFALGLAEETMVAWAQKQRKVCGELNSIGTAAHNRLRRQFRALANQPVEYQRGLRESSPISRAALTGLGLVVGILFMISILLYSGEMVRKWRPCRHIFVPCG